MKSNKAFPEQRDALDALEALDLAIKHIRGKGDKFSERNPTAVLSQLEGTRSRISHALTNPAAPTVPEAAGGGDPLPGDKVMQCPRCGPVPHRFQPSPDAGPYWRCSECGEASDTTPPQQRDALDAALKDKGYCFAELSRGEFAVDDAPVLVPILVRALANPAPPTVPEAVRRLPDEWREQCGTMDNMSRVGMAAADQRRECADELDRAIEQNEEEAERLRSILYPTEEL